MVHAGFKGIGCIELVNGTQNPETCSRDEIRTIVRTLKSSRILDQSNVDYILFDISGDSSASLLGSIIREVTLDTLLAVTTAELKALYAVNTVFTLLESYRHDSGTSLPFGGVILNNIGSSFEEEFAADFAYHTKARVIGKIPRSTIVRQAELFGKTVVESLSKSNQSYYYRRLANHIVDITRVAASDHSPQAMPVECLTAWCREWADRTYALENGLVSDGAAI